MLPSPKKIRGGKLWTLVEYGIYSHSCGARLEMRESQSKAYFASVGIAMSEDCKEEWQWYLTWPSQPENLIDRCWVYRAGHDRPPFVWANKQLKLYGLMK